MLSIDEALQQLLPSAQPVEGLNELPLEQALHRVLARPQSAKTDVPPADVSAMDGFAVNAEDVKQDEWIDVSQQIPAGRPATPLASQTAARIFTGSLIPPGANAVVIQENCEIGDKQVRLLKAAQPGNNIRPRGQDLQAGTEILAPGRRLQPQDLGLLAATGIDHVSVFRRLRVAILSSGDELMEPGNPLAPGQIYNSNRFVLDGLLRGLDIEPLHFPHIPDELNATETALKQAAAECDLVITTGGVSVGEKDHIKQAVTNTGQLDLWKLKIKPGKPLAYGRVDDIPFFGLPGNPVAAFVTFILVVRPYLLAMQGLSEVQVDTLFYPADFTIDRANFRQEYIRVRIQKGRLEKYPNQDSGALSSTSWANALAIVPPETTVAPGDPLEVIPYSHLGL